MCGGMKMEAHTDHYGDFEFDGLDSNKEYKIKLEYAGYKTCEMTVKTLKDINLGEIVMKGDALMHHYNIYKQQHKTYGLIQTLFETGHIKQIRRI
jgi:hypothetical protein